MKYALILFAAVFFIAICSGRYASDANKGRVSFVNEPVYSNDHIVFSARLELPVSGNPVDIEYEILDDNVLVASGKAFTGQGAESEVLLYATPSISVPVSKAAYSGKCLTVLLDPADKITMPSYTSDLYLPGRKSQIFVP